MRRIVTARRTLLVVGVLLACGACVWVAASEFQRWRTLPQVYLAQLVVGTPSGPSGGPNFCCVNSHRPGCNCLMSNFCMDPPLICIKDEDIFGNPVFNPIDCDNAQCKEDVGGGECTVGLTETNQMRNACHNTGLIRPCPNPDPMCEFNFVFGSHRCLIVQVAWSHPANPTPPQAVQQCGGMMLCEEQPQNTCS